MPPTRPPPLPTCKLDAQLQRHLGGCLRHDRLGAGGVAGAAALAPVGLVALAAGQPQRASPLLLPPLLLLLGQAVKEHLERLELNPLAMQGWGKG